MGTREVTRRGATCYALFVGLVVSVCSALAQQLPAPEQDTRYRFRSEARRVYVDVVVERMERDGNSTLVTGLRVADFEVLDNGVPQERVELLDTQTHPLSVVVALDLSASVRGRKLAQLESGTGLFVSSLDAADEVSVLSFGSRFELSVSRASPRNAGEFVRDLSSRGATSLIDSLFASLVQAERGVGRPVVVAFSDGEDNVSWLSPEDVAELSTASDAVVYAVRVAERGRAGVGVGRRGERAQNEPVMDPRGRAILETLTSSTGGTLLITSEPDQLSAAFEQILLELRSRYLLAFEPWNVERGGRHRLEVRLRGDSDRRRTTVRHRSGYIDR